MSVWNKGVENRRSKIPRGREIVARGMDESFRGTARPEKMGLRKESGKLSGRFVGMTESDVSA